MVEIQSGEDEGGGRGGKAGEGAGRGGGVWEKTSEEEPVLSLMSSLSSAGDKLLAPKIQSQLRSQLDSNPSINGRDFQVSRKCPLGCWGG